MTRTSLLSILTVSVASLTIVACGDDEAPDLPAGVVAQVGNHDITSKALDHAMVGRRAISLSARSAPPYWPNDVEGCIATPSKRAGAPGPDEIRARCEEERDREQTAALRLLIQGRWYALEARERGIQSNLPRQGLVDSSHHSGVTAADLADVAQAYALRLLLVPEATSQTRNFSRADIERYFKAHRERYVIDSQRFVDAIVVPTRPLARAVAAEFRRGRTSPQIMRRFGDQGATRPNRGGGLRNTISTGRDDLLQAARPLDKGDVSMIKDPGGWYVFRVAATLPRIEPTIDTARERVEQDLQARRTREAYERFNERLRTKYGSETTCVDGYSVPECE